MYGLICFSFDVLIYFTVLLSFQQKKCTENSFLAYFCNFWCTFYPIWHKLYYQHKIWSLSMKKIQDNICWSLEMSARGHFPKLVEISNNLKNCIICLKFQCPARVQIIPKLISLASLYVEKFLHSIHCMLKNFYCYLFPCRCPMCEGHMSYFKNWCLINSQSTFPVFTSFLTQWNGNIIKSTLTR